MIFSLVLVCLKDVREAILHAMNRLLEDHGDVLGLSTLLVDIKSAFNLVDREVMLREVRLRCLAISQWVEFCYSNPPGCILRITLYGHARGCSRAIPLALCYLL